MTLSKTQIAKFVYVGQGGPLSTVPLETLCKKGMFPQAIIVADKTNRPRGLNLLPVRPARTVDSLAAKADALDIPLIYWQKGSEADLEQTLLELAPELVIMSCFPWRIPASLLAIPAHGWWNLHPSLLPAYRGPTPLFWQARAGELETGVSLHQVNTGFDRGAILYQQRLSLRHSTGRDLELALATQGAALIEQALRALARGELVAQPQNQSLASYQSFPTAQDRCIKPLGAASAAYRFIELVNKSYPLWLELDNKRYTLKQAVDFDDQRQLEQAYLMKNEQVIIQFEQGVLTVIVEAD